MVQRPSVVRRARNQGLRGGPGFTLLEIMIVILIIGILAAIAVPNFILARETARTKSCVSNLTQIQTAKQQWAMENQRGATDTPTDADIFGAGAYVRDKPIEPATGADYTLNEVDTPEVCPSESAYPSHVLE